MVDNINTQIEILQQIRCFYSCHFLMTSISKLQIDVEVFSFSFPFFCSGKNSKRCVKQFRCQGLHQSSHKIGNK